MRTETNKVEYSKTQLIISEQDELTDEEVEFIARASNYLKDNPERSLNRVDSLHLTRLYDRLDIGRANVLNLASNGFVSLECKPSPLDRMPKPLKPPGWPDNVKRYSGPRFSYRRDIGNLSER